ncbi:MAG: DUF4242 domain-containing protein [Siculibacillus sp.]|nr:DUF4242 domain-containing protein [Siculibacillus sp.]
MNPDLRPMKFFIDTHDTRRGTFPAGISADAFAGFHAVYEEACRAEGVVSLRIHVGFAEGRAFCFTMTPDAEAVRRVHERVGLPFDEITEVVTSTPGDLFFARAA